MMQKLNNYMREKRSGILCFPLCLYAWYVLVQYAQTKGTYESIFGGINLGFHEMGHVVFGGCGTVLSIFGGTLLQCLIPIFSMFYFYKKEEWCGIPFSWIWLATNVFNVAVYVADSRPMSLPLVGLGDKTIHDWNYLLFKWHVLEYDLFIAGWLRVLGFFLLIGACVILSSMCQQYVKVLLRKKER